MKHYVDTLDKDSLQTALDAMAGAGTFTTGRDKLPDGTRPLYYQHDDALDSGLVAQAASVAADQDQQYREATRADMLISLLRAGAKSRLRQPSCPYSASDRDQAQAWLSSPTNLAPLAVQVRSISMSCTAELAAQQIVSIYDAYVAYPQSIDAILAQAQTNIIAATTTMNIKRAYQNCVLQLADLENTDYGFNPAN